MTPQEQKDTYLSKITRPLLVVDINYLLPEYKGKTVDELEKLLKEKYNRDVLLIDSSRVNTQGTPLFDRPAYII